VHFAAFADDRNLLRSGLARALIDTAQEPVERAKRVPPERLSGRAADHCAIELQEAERGGVDGLDPAVDTDRHDAGRDPLEYRLDISAPLVQLQVLAFEIDPRSLQLPLTGGQLSGHRVERLDQRPELVARLGLDPVIQAAGADLPGPAASSCTGRVMRLARYKPVQVALTRIRSVIIRNTDRYTPSSGPLSTAS